MKLADLVDEFIENGPFGPTSMLTPEQAMQAAVAATRYYAGYGDLSSLSLTNVLPSAPEPGSGSLPELAEPEPTTIPARPVKDLSYIGDDTEVTVGEWAIIRPLFLLYTERLNASLLEASRASGADPYGRSSSEVATEIARMEDEIIPAKAFNETIITIGG